MNAERFTIAISDALLGDLNQRLAATRFPHSLNPESWEDGASLAFMQRLVGYWREEFDWRSQERRLNELPHYQGTVDGLRVHFIHKKGQGPSPLPIILTHGWPGSFIEMERLIGLLAEPEKHGADPADAFDVVAPSLPGFGFSGAPPTTGFSSRKVAKVWGSLMTELGYPQFAAQGGDIGAAVSMWLARQLPERLLGVHLNYIPGSFRPTPDESTSPVTEDEQAFLASAKQWLESEGAYTAIQSTKPLTLSYGLSDSPAGLAAWISEKFRTWSDCGGDVERAVSLDDLLTNISLYWFSGTLDSTLRIYKENRLEPLTFAKGERVTPPLGMASFPKELPTPPRSWVERVFNVRRWTAMPRGGHFAALEQPELLAGEIRAFFRPMR